MGWWQTPVLGAAKASTLPMNLESVSKGQTCIRVSICCGMTSFRSSESLHTLSGGTLLTGT